VVAVGLAGQAELLELEVLAGVEMETYGTLEARPLVMQIQAVVVAVLEQPDNQAQQAALA
jgi:hypothetical protein